MSHLKLFPRAIGLKWRAVSDLSLSCGYFYFARGFWYEIFLAEKKNAINESRVSRLLWKLERDRGGPQLCHLRRSALTLSLNGSKWCSCHAFWVTSIYQALCYIGGLIIQSRRRNKSVSIPLYTSSVVSPGIPRCVACPCVGMVLFHPVPAYINRTCTSTLLA